ncbi:MAG: tRNA (N6-isopentenyl adenosine(37)-C2)-methylthiotransferase MiaB [Minisyncoccales bacterium]
MKYFIITFGCQMNKSDSERIASILESKGYQPASKINEADLIVVNMCSVRQSAVDRVYGLTQKLKNLKNKKQKLKTVLTGCILKEDRKNFAKIFDFILDIKELSYWPKIIKNKPDALFCYGKSMRHNYFRIEPKYQNKSLAFVPISTGCNNFCSYCVVPFTRGPLVCRPHQEILKEIKKLIKNGYKEIWLLGQNVNDYVSSANPKINFVQLIKKIDALPGQFRFFFTSPHPKNFSDKLINALAQCKKFGQYLNLPVQSGDDKILKKMNRNYSVKEYKNLVKKIREKIPMIKLSTDVIVGFPGETKQQFQNTVKLFKEIKFDNAYIAKYSPRSGTAAAKLKDSVSLTEKKHREAILRKFSRGRTSGT